MSIEKLTDGGMEIWINATNLTHWTEGIAGTSTINREAVEKHSGAYSCRLDIDVGNNTAKIVQPHGLTPNKKYKLIIWYKNSLVAKTAQALIYDNSSTVYLKSDGTWNVGWASIVFPNSTTWKKIEIEFYAHADYSNYTIWLSESGAASSSIYLDDVSILDPVDYTRDGVFLGTGTKIV